MPTILQMEAVECGAAALAMVLAYHGRTAPLEELRVACGVSRDGSKASNMLKAARSLGLEARGFKKEPKALKDISTPMIVHWNFNHFLVLEGFRKGRAYLNDPESGPRTVSEEEFDRAFTGVVLTFEPGPAFQPGGVKRSLVRSLRPRLAGSKSGLAFVIAAGLALVLPGLVSPAYQKVFVDEIIVKGLRDWLTPLLLVGSTTVVLWSSLTWLQQYFLLRLETKLALSTASRFFWHVLHLPIDFYTQRYAGEVGNRVSINDKIARLLSGDVATTTLGVVTVAFYAVLMLQYDVVLTAISVAIVALNGLALRYVSRRRVDLNARMLQDRGKLMGVAMGGLQTMETLKAMGSEADFFDRWAGHQAKTINAQQGLSFQTQLLLAVPPLLLALNTALVLGIGGLRVMDGHLTVGLLVAFQALMIAFVTPVNRFVDLGGILQEVKGDLARLDDVLRCRQDPLAETMTVPQGDGDRTVKLAGDLELRDVTFGYSRLEPPLITNLNLALKPGTRVALVGGSGCGKSTIARLVAGLYQPWSGEILFDGKLRADIPRAVLASSVALVDQDIFLFDDSVRENITLWDGTVPETDLVRAARDASIHDDITSRPGSYGARIDEGGRNFSGGQRQRMEIARALAGEPTVLILDEATSALDATTEKTIDDNLRRRGCTCLIVAHRLSTIRDCDEIVVLERGQVVQRGRHETLLAENGPYARLIAAE